MKLSYVVKGFPGHPLHPPLTDATIGVYTGATLGGAVVFTHGMRVLNLVDEPTHRAVTPGHPEKERAGV
jgi:hypothetical protein